jgi:hypothetical protein
MSESIQRMPEFEIDGNESWGRMTDEPELRGVEAVQVDDDWQVIVGVAEFLREEPLEGELRAGMDSALRAVPGVSHVAEEDREVWSVTGTVAGEALVRAAAAVVDALADRARDSVY